MVGITFAPLGQWRAQFLWRFFGLVVYQFGVLFAAHVYGRDLFFSYGLHFIFPASLILIAFGSRLWGIAVTAMLMIACSFPFLASVVERQIGEELALFTSMPTMGVILILIVAFEHGRRPGPQLVERADFHRELDAAQLTMFRIAAISTMSFATIHKLNYDFFNPDVSCAAVLSSELASWWTLPMPRFVVEASPLNIVAAEGLIALLLLTYPRLGILTCALVVGAIGHRGATAFSMLTFVLSCAFLYERDRDVLLGGLRRHWIWVLVAVLAAAPVSAKYFVAHRPWYEFYHFQIVTFLVVLGALYLIASGWGDVLGCVGEKGLRAVAPVLAPRRRDDGWRRVGTGARIALAGFALLTVLNGLSPYLGLKYRLSFAMLSNLRVDDNRWNSMLFPRWLYLRDHDPFVHVSYVKMDPRGEELMNALDAKHTRGMYPGLFSPMSFKYRMKYVEFNATRLDVNLEYQGREYSFRDALRDPKFVQWVAALPDGKMFHEGLTGEGPQPCVH